MYFPEFRTAGTAEILTVIAALSFILLLVNYFIHYFPLSSFKHTHIEAADKPLPVSLIICARNEEDNLRKFLPIILTQDHPDYEVVVVNDCSWDNTENVIDEFARQYPQLRKTTIKEDRYYKHGKKFAMLVGIKAAKHEHMVFTDADCFPSSNTWLSIVARGFTGKREIVLGYGAYARSEGFLNKLIRFDSFIIATQFMSAAIKHRPYMGVGRNLAYTKSVFFGQRGFSRHYHINSGDDDLLVNHASNAENTNICASQDCITYSEAEPDFKSWRVQKARHLSTAPLYTTHAKAYLFFNYFSQYFFYASLVTLAFSKSTVLLIPAILLLKYISQIALLNNAAKKLGEKDLLVAAPLYELALLFIYPIFHGSKLFYKPERWTN
jgi:poly-beta-1,6-N-acetyl-D-glucosamine synthase